jgi:indolepyruvate ferredoxin oxidoreductase, alpha subunit
MSKKLVMGNAAIAYGAIRAGVNFVTGYPGTPSSEILETIAKNNNKNDIYVEWSVNEKAALEVAAGASMAGARVMVTMKQVGLNVASDPLMCLNYVGIKGGMVVVVADDPGPISSQTEQDTRHYAQFAKMMCFDPSSPQEAYEMVLDAFHYSEKIGKPVFLRPTTRVCHGYQSIEILEDREEHIPDGFVKDSSRWVIFPKLAYQNHMLLEKMLCTVSQELSSYRFNELKGVGKLGIATGGVSCEYLKEILGNREDIKILKIATPNPFPVNLAVDFLDGLETVLVVEELDPVIENELIKICKTHHLTTTIKGKLSGDTGFAGENTVAGLAKIMETFFDTIEDIRETIFLQSPPELAIRPPVLCAGCPHRASFYAVKKAMEGQKATFCGDIGCYTLGNAKPLDMVDTCLCMGAGITIAQGLNRIQPDTFLFSFIEIPHFLHQELQE